MSPKQPSKEKRAAQNRQQRAAREARAANANAPAPRSAATGGASAPRGSLLSRLRGGGTGATAGSARAAQSQPATRPSARANIREARALQPPGYRAALSAVFAAVAAIILCTFILQYPVDARGELYTSEMLTADWSQTVIGAVADQPDATPAEIVESLGDDWNPGGSKEPVVQALWPFSLAIALPLIGAGIAFHAVRKRAPSKVVNRALYATLFGAVLTQGLMLLFLPVVLAVAVAMFQVRKTEAMATAMAAADNGVIDVDEVDDDADLDDADLDDAVEEEDADSSRDSR